MSNTFKLYPTLMVLFLTSDGTEFFKEETANEHARKLKDRTVKTVQRPEESKLSTKADDILKLVPEMDLDTANEYLTAENALKSPRKSVVDDLTAKVAELENPAE